MIEITKVIELIKEKKKTVFIIGAALIVVLMAVVLAITIRSCGTEVVPTDNQPDTTQNPGDNDIEGTNNHNDNGQEEDVEPTQPNGGTEDDPMPSGVTDLKALKKNLVSENSTNVLILGEDQLYGLIDTVGIISIDKKAKKITIIMIPRDTYIQYNSRVLDFLRAYNRINEPGVFKINYAYYLGWFMHSKGWDLDFKGKFDKHSYGVSFITQVIEEKFDLAIHDFIKVDTEGFVELVDLFGGVEIYVPYDMHYEDAEQDLYIHLEKGLQRLYGKQAEGFVRFRTGVDEEGNVLEYGDFERKKNQIEFLKAFVREHGTLENIDKVPSVLQIMGNRLWSSIKVTDVLFKYTSLAVDIITDKYEIDSYTITGRSKMINNSWYLVVE